MGQPIRVAQIMGKMNGGGVEAVVMNYYRHIDRDQVQFDFIVNTGSTQIPRDEIEKLGGRVFEIPSYTHQIAFQRELIRLMKEEKWKIVHSHINALSVLSLHAASKAGVPIRIAHSHNTSGKGEHVRNVVKNILRIFANVYPTHRFACGEYAGRWLFGEKADFEIIYNAIELDTYAFDADVREQMRNVLGISNNQLVIGHIGRFEPQKNHEFLLEAFSLLCKRRDDCVLLCAGEGGLLKERQQQAESLGIADKVKFLGYREDVSRLYQAFDVFVLPSLYEGLCVVGVEAQKAGLVCFMSDQITREISITDNIRYLSIDNPEIWTDALAAFDENEHLIANRVIPDEIFELYDIETAASKLKERYMVLYSSVENHSLDEEEGDVK